MAGTNIRRRSMLAGGALAALAWLAAAAGLSRPNPGLAQQWNRAAFEAADMNEALRALGAANAVESKAVRFANPTPEVADNGDAVPIAVASAIPGTRSIAVLVEKNPTVLSARFDIPAGTEAFVSTRIRMGASSAVVALVGAGGNYYYARKQIEVEQCGCGA
ncbi:MAG: thiosulfate oxidation carrier protein SoxY [Betaproteobacteria bacterium]|nr:thiosulfate oxidation carrier protein SoxY [Betaproteobacteria bacterium]